MKIKADWCWHDILRHVIISDNSNVVRLLGAPARLISTETKSVLVDDAGLVSCENIQCRYSSFVRFIHWDTNNLSKYALEAVIKQ
jgi:hypothetical protein